MIYDKTGNPMKTITSPELKRLEFCNSKSINGETNGVPNSIIIKEGILYDWVGIGWVDHGKATPEDYEKYTELV